MKTTKEYLPRLFSTLLLLLLLFGSIKAADSTYYFSTFGSDSDQKLYVYSSVDGVNFSLFNSPGFAGPTGVLRDPALFHYNNKYYIAFTIQSWTTSSTAFAIASSDNMLSWTTIATVDCGIPNTYYTWAPDWFVDSNKINLIVSLGTSSNMKPYIYTANDTTLTSWSAPVDMGIDTNHIDAFVVKTDTAYHCFCKNETSKNIERYTSSSLTGPWTLKNGLWSYYEGVSLIRQDTVWRIYIDMYALGGGMYSATSKDLNTWSSLINLHFGRHGSCIKTATLPTSIKFTQTQNNITIYPNPIDNKQLRIEGLAENVLIKIVDINGNVHKEESSLEMPSIQLYVNLSAGEYLVQIISPKKQ
jgi:hypothetical protein